MLGLAQEAWGWSRSGGPHATHQGRGGGSEETLRGGAGSRAAALRPQWRRGDKT